MLDAAQIAMRPSIIGASQIGQLANLVPFKNSSPQDCIARDYLGWLPRLYSEEMSLGDATERLNLIKQARYESMLIDPEQTTVRHPDVHWIGATADGLSYEPETGTGRIIEPWEAAGLPLFAVNEAKWVGFRVASHWTDPDKRGDGIPLYVMSQVTWQMAVWNIRQAIVGAFVRGEHWRYRVEFDERLFEALHEIGRKMWGYIQRRELPPVTMKTARAARQFVKTFYSQQRGKRYIHITGKEDADLGELRAQHEQFRLQEKEAKEDKEEIAAILQGRVGSAPGMEGTGWRVNWPQGEDKVKVDNEAMARSLAGDRYDELSKDFEYVKKGSRTFTTKEMRKK